MANPDDLVTDRVMRGRTPLQVVAASTPPPTALRSIERFPYYTAFPFSWYLACYSDELAAGEVKALRLLGRDLIAWRGEDGAAHVMDAYCPHLGAHLGYGGRVEGCHIVCPYHWWEYDGDGRNVRIPYSGRTNARAQVGTYPTIDRNGLVMFWYHPRREPPKWEIPAVAEYGNPEWTDYHKAAWTVRCPWQEMAENGPDFIHLRTVHGSVDIPELETWGVDGYRTVLRTKVNFDTPRGPRPGRIDTDGWGPGFGLARFTGIIETLMVACTTPIDFEHTLSHKAYLVRKSADTPDQAARAHRLGHALVADLEKQMLEDIVIFDNKVWNEHPALADADGPVLKFRSWARQFYVDGDTRAVNR